MSGRTAIRKHWPIIILLLCGAGAMAVLLGRYSAPTEPGYAGRPLGFWLAQLDGVDPGQAQIAIRGIGPKAIPFLFKKVRRENSRSERWYRAAWSRLPSSVEKHLPDPEPDARLRARIVAALRLLETRGMPAIVDALDDPDSNVRAVAVATISAIGPQASSAVPSLIRRVTDPNPEVRAAAVLAFRYMGPDRAHAVPALTRALEDDTVARPDGKTVVHIRELAIQVLGKVGSAAQPAVPALSRMLTDSNPVTRQQAMLALWRITRDTNLVERATLELSRASEAPACKRFLDVLSEMGPAARPAVPVIRGLMTNAPPGHMPPGADLISAGRAALRKIAPEIAAALPETSASSRAPGRGL